LAIFLIDVAGFLGALLLLATGLAGRLAATFFGEAFFFADFFGVTFTALFFFAGVFFLAFFLAAIGKFYHHAAVNDQRETFQQPA